MGRDVKGISLLFLRFGISLFASKYLDKSLNNLTFFLYNNGKAAAEIRKLASSANMTTLTSAPTASTISPIYNINNKGQRIEPLWYSLCDQQFFRFHTA